MAYISKITPLGSNESYDLKAAMLTHTPNNTTTFLRGDNTWSNTLTGNLLLSKDANTAWANAPALQLTGADNKIALIKLTNSGTNLDIGWDWTAREGAGIGFRSTSSTDTTGGFYLFARDATEEHNLVGKTNGDLTWTGLLKITNNSNTTTIGSQNANFCHIYNSVNIPFIFNNSVLTTGGNLGNSTYPFDNLTLGRSNGAGIYYQGTKATYRMIRFIDNTNDNYGNGISIGGGGQTIIGGGESADTAAAQAGTAGAEIMQVCNDGNVELIANLQNGWDNRKVLTLNTSGYLMCPSYINVPTSNNENPTLSQFIVTNGSDHYYRKASAAHAMAAIRSNASGSWGISITGSAAYLTAPNTAGVKTDQYGNFQHQRTTTTDYWTIQSNAGVEKFKVNFENGDTNVNGTIYITPSLGNYREGIRIKPYSGWATIVLGGNDLTADSGTSANTWSIHNSNGSFYITRNGSSSGTAQLACVSNKWSISGNITSPSTASSWVAGQNSTNAAYNVGNATDTGSYWPWLRQTNTASTKWFSFGTLNTSFYWIGSATSRTENGYDYGMQFNVANGYLQGCSRVYGAVWNDYAEYRKNNPNEIQEPGRCIKELGDGSLALTTQRLERGCEIVSDTFGFAIGQDEKNGYNTPIASNGRVLVYPYESIEEFANHIGWPVCSGPNGTVSIMTEEEEEKYPSRIIGTISEIPNYEEWGTGKVKVDGRIWIRIR